MALIHEKLYQSSNLAAIDFGGYVRGLTTHLVRSYGGGVRGISVQVDAEELSLGLDRAVPCGIILNELLSNSLKHAFPDGSAGSIRVELRLLDGRDIVLTVLDDGVGLPADFDLLTSESLGLKLVRMLADQLQGKMSVESHSRAEGENHGTIFRIQFER
jgi:two-component sensor histidine kinase